MKGAGKINRRLGTAERCSFIILFGVIEHCGAKVHGLSTLSGLTRLLEATTLIDLDEDCLRLEEVVQGVMRLSFSS